MTSASLNIGATHVNDINAWIADLFTHPDMLRMGHCQRRDDLNLGLGWVYYSLARSLRPTTAVVIGSYRGFVPLVLAKAMSDNVEGGVVHFIDPSLVDDFWKDEANVGRHFALFGIDNIRHYPMTTQKFVASPAHGELRDVGLLFVDGMHTYEQAKFDYEAFEPLLTEQAVVLFHDSVRVRTSKLYGDDRAYDHRVKCYMDELKARPGLQVFDLPLGGGVTLVRKVGPIPPRHLWEAAVAEARAT